MSVVGLHLFAVLALGAGCGDDDRPMGTVDAGGGGGTDAGGGGGTDAGGGGTDAGGGGTDAGGGASAWETYCTVEGPERTMRCTPGDVFDVAECQASGACYETIFIEGGLDLVAGCLAERDCGTSDDHCGAPETYGLTPSAAASAYASECTSRRSSCAAGTMFSEDFCFTGLASDEAISAMDACLDLADCTEVRSCLIDIVTCAG